MKRFVFVLAAAAAFVPAVASPQGRPATRRERPGFDFSPTGVWRKKARRIQAMRAQLLAQGNFAALNAARSGPARATQAALVDTLFVPVMLMRFKDTDTTTASAPSLYQQVLFATSPPLSRPYTYRTFYEQLSNGVFSVQGQVTSWIKTDSIEKFYTDSSALCGGFCNGINSNHAVMRMQAGFREMLLHADSTIDFGQYDNDGPDGIPNSGDDDGYVDLALFVQAQQDGACGGNSHPWSHRFVLVDTNSSGAFSTYKDYVTNDPAANGGTIRVRDYLLQSGLGGATGCTSSAIMGIGTVAHETGHGLGLPDLYDTQYLTDGIGDWGLMSGGEYTTAISPSRMEAWSLQQFGWLTVAPITTNGTYSFGPVPTSDTTWIIRPTGSNPRGEYYLLENRQASESDTALIRLKGPGLLIWHVDSQQVVNHGINGDNRVNSGPIHGLRLEEADGLAQLWSVGARGDAGDPYPGTSNNTVFSYATNPANVKNSDGTFAGFQVDSIKQISVNGPMSFRVQFGGFSLVRASDTSATVQFDSVNYNVFRGLLANASSHAVGVADTQFTNAGRNRFRYQSWSDAGARVHAISGTFAGETLIATLAKDFKTQIATVGNGSVAQSPAADATGFVPSGSPDTLTATPSGGFAFDGWTGDTTGSNLALVLPMARPYNVTVTFSPTLVISSAATRPDGVMGAAYNDALAVTGGNGTNHWHVVSGALPTGVTLSLGGVLSGYPKQTGAFSYTARDTSGLQIAQVAFSFNVNAPTLLTADVVTQLLTGTSSLNADALRYLDYLGNNNNPAALDVGDFLAWVNATGAPLSAPRPAVATSTRVRKGGRP
ncbi:MAG TPA: M6 family metalloprotease domain-containing protein [Gemmatimonadales bacterium]|nr:M6 family metalloprotease domain-containing protein [Gemmatimonadales bacterium]